MNDQMVVKFFFEIEGNVIGMTKTQWRYRKQAIGNLKKRRSYLLNKKNWNIFALLPSKMNDNPDLYL